MTARVRGLRSGYMFGRASSFTGKEKFFDMDFSCISTYICDSVRDIYGHLLRVQNYGRYRGGHKLRKASPNTLNF